MKALGALVHFRTLEGSEWFAEGNKGGFCWFLGRFDDWIDFYRAIDEELEVAGCSLIEVEDQSVFRDRSEYDNEETIHLFDKLTDYPLQFESWHLYKNLDA